MSTQRKPTRKSAQSSRVSPSRNDEPVSITKPIPGSMVFSEEPKAYVERLGDALKRLREQRGDDLLYISEYLCIKPNFLEALENNRYHELPADAYVIGFLRSYANYLGIDGKEAIDRYRSEMAGRRKKPDLVLPTPIGEGRTPSAIIMAAVAITAILIYAIWYGISSSDRSSVSKPPALPTTAAPESTQSTTQAAGSAPLVPPAPADTGIVLSSMPPSIQEQATPAPQASAQPTTPRATAAAEPAKTATATPPAPAAAEKPKPPEEKPAEAKAATQADTKQQGDAHVSIRATQASWVLITDKTGRAIYDHVMQPGDVYRVPDKAGLSLTTGNGAGVVLSLDGSDLPKLASGTGHVIRNMSLDTDHLRSLPASSDE